MPRLLAVGHTLFALLMSTCSATRGLQEETQALSSNGQTLYTQCCVKDGFNVGFEDATYQDFARHAVQTLAWARVYYEEAASDEEEISYVQNASKGLNVSGPPIVINQRLRDGVHQWSSMTTEGQDLVYKSIWDFLVRYEVETETYMVRKSPCSAGFVEANDQHRCNDDFISMQALLYTVFRLHTADSELEVVDAQQRRLEEMVKQLQEVKQNATNLRAEKDRLLKKLNKLSLKSRK